MNNNASNSATWKTLRTNLNSNYSFLPEWSKAVELFNQRIQSRYFQPIDLLINSNLKIGEGFTIVTIQCALIETFAAFKEGLIYNHAKPEVGGFSYEYRDSSDLFIRFLNSELIFKGIFYSTDPNGNKQKNIPFSATQFYSQVRCGLMHETRTKGKWIIKTTPENSSVDQKFIKAGVRGDIIYRTLFQVAIKKYFDQYKEDLAKTGPEYDNLRKQFARKMDHLDDIKDNYDWWQ